MENTSQLSSDLEQMFRQGTEHLLAGRAVESEAIYRRILEQQPDSPGVRHNLGVALKSQHKLEEAVAAFHRALALRPQYPEAYNNLGDTLRELNQPAQGLEALRAALALRPDFPEVWNNMGMILRNLGRLPQAIEAYRRALALRPGFAEAWGNMGNTLREMKRLAESIEAYRRALALRPTYPEAWNNLGGTLRQAGRAAEAMEAYRQALKVRPDYADAWSNLGIVLREKGQHMEAIEVFQRALALQETLTGAWINLGVTYKDTGRLDESLACYDRVMKIQPSHAEAAGGRLCTVHYHPGYDAMAIYREAQRWNDRFARPFAGEYSAWPNEFSPQRRLRIGYVSPDFRGHCQSLFTTPLMAHHDHQEVEIFCYANVENPDVVTGRLKGYADVWRDIYGLTDQAAAQAIRQDKIDILVDLALHSAGNRLGVFARKPAPIQATWLGYPGTTGLDAIDYRLTDPRLDPEASSEIRNPKSEIRTNDPNSNVPISKEVHDLHKPMSHSGIGPLGVDSDFGFRISDFSTKEPYYSERSIRLPDGYWCYNPKDMHDIQDPRLLQPGPLPALEAGHVTFACLNNFCKITSVTLELWAGVMAAIPTAQLILVAPPGPHRDQVAKNLGVAPQRVQYLMYQPRQQYLETYRRIDLCLDSLPFNGGTTSLDALWMGVPVLTRVGRTVVGRAGASHLHQLDLPEFITRTDEEFVQRAVEWAGDLGRLSTLRGALRSRMERSPLMDGKRFARNVERAYRQMWQVWCSGAPAKSRSGS